MNGLLKKKILTILQVILAQGFYFWFKLLFGKFVFQKYLLTITKVKLNNKSFLIC